ncbi:uncharacterized protein [Argopecten irradians]|uniref:uncharacterized protein n=1 Tax=Argopecten irradians TaxID=31199 RepID=UPI00371A6B1E
MPTPSWPTNGAIGPHGFSFPSSFQDSFHKPVRIDELDEPMNTGDLTDNSIGTAEKNRLERLRKESALTVSIPQSSGYDSCDDHSKGLKGSVYHVMDIEQENRDNSLQEQKQFLDSTDGSCDQERQKKRRINCYWTKCRIAIAIVVGTLLLFSVIFGAIYLAKYLDSRDDKNSDDTSTNRPHVETGTTPKPQVVTKVTPSIDPNDPLVAIRMVVDEEYAQNGKGHLVLWRPPQGHYIHQGITYNNGYFKVPVDGYYSYTSTLKFDTRTANLDTDREIHFHHCVSIKNTQKRSCSTNGVPVGAIRSDSVHDSWVHLRAGQEVYVTISKVGYISDTSDSNTFTMSLTSTQKDTR